MAFTIRRFIGQDAGKVSALILEIFNEFNESEVSQDGKEFFLNLHKPESILANWPSSYAIVMERGNDIIGVGRAKENGWITHCFVARAYMDMGLGKELMVNLEKWLKSLNVKIIHLNSSPFAVDFYRKMGYSKCGRIKVENGIPHYSMKKYMA